MSSTSQKRTSLEFEDTDARGEWQVIFLNRRDDDSVEKTSD